MVGEGRLWAVRTTSDWLRRGNGADLPIWYSVESSTDIEPPRYDVRRMDSGEALPRGPFRKFAARCRSGVTPNSAQKRFRVQTTLNFKYKDL